MNLRQPFFQSIELELVLPLNLVNLLFQYVYFFIDFGSLSLIFFVSFSQLSQKSLNLVIFNANQFSETIHLNIKKLRLILLGFMNVLQLEVKQFLEFFLHLLNFVVFLLDSLLALSF
jgi:hypothetical protein